MNQHLYSIKGKTTIELAIYFLKTKTGDKILSIHQFSEKYNVARGTIQTIIEEMICNNIIKVDKRGRLGTILLEKDNSKLLNLMGKNHLLGTMPLPYTKRYEGLATGVISALKKELMIQVSMSYMKNADSRIELLKEERVDFAIVSQYHAQQVVSKNEDLTIFVNLDDYTYLSKHVIIKASDNVKNVGVDANSLVHRYLIEKNFDNVNLVQIEYSNLKSSLDNGIIDATIMNFDDVEPNKDVYQVNEIIEMTRASILINENNSFLKNIVDTESLAEKILKQQEMVISKALEPRF